MFGQPSPSAGGDPSLLRPSLAFQMSLNFSERRNSTGPAPFASPPLCGLEGSSSGRPNGTSVSYDLTSGEAAVLGLVFSVLWLVSAWSSTAAGALSPPPTTLWCPWRVQTCS